jgi:hypothetical protein
MDAVIVSNESAVEPQKPWALGARKPKNRLERQARGLGSGGKGTDCHFFTDSYSTYLCG